MSINISGLPNKSQIRSLPTKEPVVEAEDENKAYSIKCVRVKNEILRKIAAKDDIVKVRVGFLTERDKNALIQDISRKGYSCYLEKGLLTIQ